MSHTVTAPRPNPFFRRLWAGIEAASLSYDEIQDMRMARLEAEVRHLRAIVEANAVS